MAAQRPRLADLSEVDRQELESWLVEFDQNWGAEPLSGRASQIPPGSSWRLPALAEMVKIDLERQWQAGHRVSLESYLLDFPSSDAPDDVSVDLIQAEYEVRRQFGAPADVEEYVRRFPHQAGRLRRAIGQSGSSVGRPSAFSSRRSDSVRKPSKPEPELPEQFGRYRIIKRLGQGGMGSVYLAEDTELGRKVALKVAHSASAGESSESRERFIREARAAATIDHPYLCQVHDVGIIDGIHFLTMAYIPGRSLADSIPSEGLPPRQVAALVGKLAVALQEAHARGVVHRDLKPSNVMIKVIGQRREPVIVDFGLARQENSQDIRVTKSGQVLGTPAYMAPEQIRADFTEIGPTSDIYALGVILYEMLTGRLPFQGPPLAVVGQILTQEPEPPSAIRPGLDSRLESICLKAMAKKIKDRYNSMGDLAAALTDYLKNPTPSSLSTPSQATGPRPSGPDTLVNQSLNRVAAENASAPIQIQEPKPLAKYRQKIGQIVALASTIRGRRPSRGVLIAASSFILVLGVIIYVATDKGRIKIVVADPEAIVKVDGDMVSTRTRGEPHNLRAGTHNLEVTWGGGQLQTNKFVVKRGENEDLSIEYAPTTRAPSLERAIGKGSIGNSIGMRLNLIPVGEFLMGVPGSEKEASDEEKPQHRVRITRSFYLALYEVTQGQYRAVTGENPSFFKGSDDLPVEQVSWNDAVSFCNKLSEREGLALFYRIEGDKVEVADPRGPGYRLPTEDEWEYTCRAGPGGAGAYSFGDDAAQLDRHAWYNANSVSRTYPVGQKAPNAWGLFDMHGNVWEWCWNGYAPYGPSPAADTTVRVLRGGSWSCSPRYARSALRGRLTPGNRGNDLGFRVARVRSGGSPTSDAEGPARTPAGKPSEPPAKPAAVQTNSIGMKLMLIPPGNFYLAAFKVTQDQYMEVMGINPSHFRGSGRLPVETVTWFDAIEFCNRLSEREGLRPYYKRSGKETEILGGDRY